MDNTPLKSNTDGPREDLYHQIFTKIRQDENTFIHFSTVKGNVRYFQIIVSMKFHSKAYVD